MYIQNLLDALDNDYVRSKIKSIMLEGDLNEHVCKPEAQVSLIPSEDIEQIKANLLSVENENLELKELIAKLKVLLGIGSDEVAGQRIQAKVIELKGHVTDKEQKFQQLLHDSEKLNANLKKLKLEQHELTEKLEYYRDNFGDDLNVFELYNRLSKQTRLSLSGIFKDTTIQGVIACGIQEKNISNLWDYAKNELVNGGNNDISDVIGLFELLFKRFTLAYPMFVLQVVNCGEKFDTQIHIKHNSSTNSSGCIKTVLLKGYVNTKTNKVIKNSVVVL